MKRSGVVIWDIQRSFQHQLIESVIKKLVSLRLGSKRRTAKLFDAQSTLSTDSVLYSVVCKTAIGFKSNRSWKYTTGWQIFLWCALRCLNISTKCFMSSILIINKYNVGTYYFLIQPNRVLQKSTLFLKISNCEADFEQR